MNYCDIVRLMSIAEPASSEEAGKFLAAVCSGKSPKKASENLGLELKRIWRLYATDSDFRDELTKALEAARTVLLLETLEIADDSSRDALYDADGNYVRPRSEVLERSKIQIAARKLIIQELKQKPLAGAEAEKEGPPMFDATLYNNRPRKATFTPVVEEDYMQTVKVSKVRESRNVRGKIKEAKT